MDINEIISSGLLELYATGLTSAEETQQVQQWAAEYPEVAEELRQIEDSVIAYGQSQAVPPPAHVKDRIFTTINQTESETAKIIPITTHKEEPPAKIVKVSSFWRNAAAAAVLLLIGSVIGNIVLVNKNKETAGLLENTKQSLAALEEQNKEINQDMQVVKSKYSQPVSLAGLDATAPDAAAKVFWMKNTGEVFIDPSNLPAAPQGKRYELWAIVDGKPVNAGIIITAKNGDQYRIQKMKTFGKVEAFAVSIEDIKDQPATTPGQVFMMGKI